MKSLHSRSRASDQNALTISAISATFEQKKNLVEALRHQLRRKLGEASRAAALGNL